MLKLDEEDLAELGFGDAWEEYSNQAFKVNLYTKHAASERYQKNLIHIKIVQAEYQRSPEGRLVAQRKNLKYYQKVMSDPVLKEIRNKRYREYNKSRGNRLVKNLTPKQIQAKKDANSRYYLKRKAMKCQSKS